MKVLVSCPVMKAMGGAERFVLSVVIGLVERGNEVGLVAGRGGLDAELHDVPHERFLLPPPARSVIRLARIFRAMRAAVLQFRPDVIHAQNVVHAALAAAAARTVPGPRPPVLATFHGVQPSEYSLAVRLFRAADAVACVSDDLLAVLLRAGFPAGRAHLVQNGIGAPTTLTRARSEAIEADLRLAPQDGGGRVPLVVAVGRLVPEKAYDRFLRAAAWVAPRQPSTRFAIVGDGELRNDLQALAHELGLADNVVFTLFRPDARDIIAKADLVVFSSLWEGLPIAALEALACGTPVVSTTARGMRSLLSSGAGEIVDGDAESMGRAILALLQDDERRAAMSAEGRRLAVGTYSAETMLDHYVRLYHEITSRRARSSTAP